MWHYDTNYMGPINKEWLDNNPGDWAGGRIDCNYSGDNEDELEKIDNHYKMSTEIDVPIMDGKSWCELTNFLESFKSEKLLTLEDIIDIMEDNGFNIEFHKIEYAKYLN